MTEDNGMQRYITEKLEDLSTNVSKIFDTQQKQHETLAENTATLVEHVRRTDILEKKVEETMSFINMVKGSWKMVLFIAFCMGAVATFYEVKESIAKDAAHQSQSTIRPAP